MLSAVLILLLDQFQRGSLKNGGDDEKIEYGRANGLIPAPAGHQRFCT